PYTPLFRSRGEVVAVVPLHALTDTQRVFGGVVVDLPAFKQHAADRAVDFVFDQIVEPAAAEVRVLGPVPGARVLLGARFHLHPERAAGNRRILRAGRSVEAQQAVGRGAGDAEGRGTGQELAPAH